MKTNLQEVEPPRIFSVSDESRPGSLETARFALGKRAIDISIALPIVCFVLPPLMVFVFMLHSFVSKGSLFFRQERCGRNGKVFSILKFRTMSPDSEDGNSATPRVFRFGNFLRFSKIDELPQFVNVLRGEMSVVGPRPHHLQDCINFEARVAGYRNRYVVKPGITGLAQIREYAGDFRWDCTDSRVKLDLIYIESRSLTVDIKLIFQTLSTVAFQCQKKVFQKIFVVASEDSDRATSVVSISDSTTARNAASSDESHSKAA